MSIIVGLRLPVYTNTYVESENFLVAADRVPQSTSVALYYPNCQPGIGIVVSPQGPRPHFTVRAHTCMFRET